MKVFDYQQGTAQVGVKFIVNDYVFSHVSKMLKDNAVFVQSQGVEAIRKNHHNLQWHLFNRVSSFSKIIYLLSIYCFLAPLQLHVF